LGNKSGKLNYSLLYTHSNDDGYRQNAKTELNDVKLKARYDIDARQYLLLSTSYSETNGGYAYEWFSDFIPATLTFIAHPERAYDIAYEDSKDDLIKRKNALVGLNYVNLLSDKLSLDTRIYYTHNGTRYEYNPSGPDEQIIVGYYPAGPPFFGAPIYVTSQPVGNFNVTYSNRLGAGTKLDWRVNNCNRLVVGLEGSTTDLKTTQPTTAWPTARVLDDINEKSWAAFVQDEWKITNKLTSLFSLRYDWSGINGDQVQTSSAGPWNGDRKPLS